MNPFQFLLLLFIITPIIEIYLLFTVGHLIGAGPTLLLLLVAAITGSHLLRTQGLTTLQKVQSTVKQGQLPTETILEGLLLLIAGFLLLMPGFLTDIIALVCLIPVFRKYLIYKIIQYLQAIPVTSPPSRKSPTIIEGTYRREDD